MKRKDEPRPRAPRGFSRPPLERMLRLHERMKAGAFPNCRTLAGEFEVSTKTIQRDIEFMRDRLRLPIEYHALRFGFYYTQPVEAFPSVEVSEGELVALLVAQKALEQYRGTSFEKPLAAAFGKITAGLRGGVVFDGGAPGEAFSFRNIGASVADLELFDLLSQAVLRSREVRFEYRKLAPAAQPEWRTVCPYHLTCVENLWYLVGLDRGRGQIRTFALPRFGRAEETGCEFTRPADFDPEAYFSNSFGIFRGEGRYRVRIRFTGVAARLVAEREWHPTQKLATSGDGQEAELELEVNSLTEVERWVLGWGRNATVLEPPELVARLRATAKALAEAYPST